MVNICCMKLKYFLLYLTFFFIATFFILEFDKKYFINIYFKAESNYFIFKCLLFLTSCNFLNIGLRVFFIEFKVIENSISSNFVINKNFPKINIFEDMVIFRLSDKTAIKKIIKFFKRL